MSKPCLLIAGRVSYKSPAVFRRTTAKTTKKVENTVYCHHSSGIANNNKINLHYCGATLQNFAK
jgi:hypothetical protein